jgi:3'-5' exoribonuclease
MKIVKIHLASQDDKERIKFLKQAPLDSQFMINEIKKFIK